MWTADQSVGCGNNQTAKSGAKSELLMGSQSVSRGFPRCSNSSGTWQCCIKILDKASGSVPNTQAIIHGLQDTHSWLFLDRSQASRHSLLAIIRPPRGFAAEFFDAPLGLPRYQRHHQWCPRFSK